MLTPTRTPLAPGRPARLARILRPEWLGQTLASLCWIASVLVYGLAEPGDWLQLLAASSWFASNAAVIFRGEPESGQSAEA